VEIKYDFDESKSQFGATKKSLFSGPEPLFLLDAEFKEEEIAMSDMDEIKVKKYNPQPGNPSVDDFDPICHLELEEEEEYKSEESRDPMDFDESELYVSKFVCKNIHKYWIKCNPSKNSFIELINESIEQGYSSLKSFERWSRHGELLKYVKVLESWDDMVCDSWDPPDENYLDCDTCLAEEDLHVKRSEKISRHFDEAFSKADKYIENFRPYLQIYWDNK
jgi:hypothetical protein